MVVAADSERRRIERDLHDGAQARLVSLAMELGRAKARFDDDPEAAKELVAQAHEEAKAALVELRGLVRGVHPPVLTDRGLDAALSGLAAICPVPVTVKTDMTGRPPAAVEAVAYFVVAEALTNVAKHSGATNCIVDVRYDGSVLHALVIDDGRGGARADGAGLSGLADRVQAVDGRLSVDSPPGGPTVIEVETAMRVMIAEDSVLLREGLCRLLSEAGVEVTAATPDAEAFLRAVGSDVPDAVVVDVRMPPTFSDEGLRAALVVRKSWPSVGRSGPFPIRRGALRGGTPEREGERRGRLPVEGPRGRGGRVRRRAATSGQRGERHRPRGRRPVAHPQGRPSRLAHRP